MYVLNIVLRTGVHDAETRPICELLALFSLHGIFIESVYNFSNKVMFIYLLVS